jgi:hypothetical protein
MEEKLTRTQLDRIHQEEDDDDEGGGFLNMQI